MNWRAWPRRANSAAPCEALLCLLKPWLVHGEQGGLGISRDSYFSARSVSRVRVLDRARALRSHVSEGGVWELWEVPLGVYGLHGPRSLMVFR